MIDTISAQRAMKIAKSYLDETDGINLNDERSIGHARYTLSLAAKQLAQANKADPNATIDIDEVKVGIPFLRASVLLREARTWENFKLSKAIDLATQAALADKYNPYAFHVLGIYYMDARNTAQAKKVLTIAAELDPENTEILKDLDRVNNMSGLSVAGFKAADAGIKSFNILVVIWNIFAITWNVFTFPLRLVARMMGIIR